MKFCASLSVSAKTFNRTAYGIEIANDKSFLNCSSLAFNRTAYGIEMLEFLVLDLRFRLLIAPLMELK